MAVLEINPNQMPREMWEAQAGITKLWQKLGKLEEISVAPAIEVIGVALVKQGGLAVNENELVAGLEMGRLIAIRTKGRLSVSYNLMCLAEDAYFDAGFPLKPITVRHDVTNGVLPVPVNLEKWDFGLKVNKGVGDGRGGWFYHHGQARYFNLAEDVAHEAWDLYDKLRIGKGFEK